jgi:hypothetical protein
MLVCKDGANIQIFWLIAKNWAEKVEKICSEFVYESNIKACKDV